MLSVWSTDRIANPNRAEPSSGRVGCRRPDRRFRARRSLLVALALVLGAISPFAAALAEAQVPAAPTNLMVSAGDETMGLTWTKPSGTLTGYDLHYTSSTTVGDTDAASGNDASAAWVEVTGPPGTADRQSISPVTNGRRYRVRLRAKNSEGAGPWAFTTGTAGIFLQWPSTTYTQAEDNETAHQARLRTSRPSRNINGTLTYAAGATNGASLSDDLQSGYATTFSARRHRDLPTATVALPVDDTVNEEDETFTIKINAGTDYIVRTPDTLTVTITDNDPPAAPSGLSVRAGVGPGKLTASWTKPAGPVTEYEWRYKQTTAPDRQPTRPNDPATGWVTQSITTTTVELSGLTSGTAYEVQVRANDGQTGTGNGWGAWSASQTRTGPSSDAFLSGFPTVTSSTSASGTFTAVHLEPDGPTELSGTVPNSHTHAKVTPTVRHSGATVKLGKQGTTLATIASGSTSGAIALDVGANIIEVVVTAEDGTTTRSHTVTITREAAATDANLSGLTATSATSAGGTFTSLTLSPSFSATTRSYAATVANARTHTKVTPTVAHSSATVTVNGTTVSSGSASGAIALSVGSNKITVRVTAQDGTTSKDYIVTITRGAAPTTSSDATLSGLTATTSTSAAGAFTTLNIGTFAASTTSYTATVANSRTHAKLTPTVNHSSATVTVAGTAVSSGSASGAIALSVGANAITVRVTAQDGTTTKDYTVTITREAAQSSNANLSGLTATTSTSSTATFTSLTLTPSTFSATTTSYTATVVNGTTHAKVTPTVAHSSATVTVDGTTVSSGSASGAIALSVGANTITVRVTAQDGTTTKDYTVTITRQAANVPPAVSLSASPSTVTEGSSVTVTATLSAALSSAVTIPVTVSTASPNTAESGDVGTLTSITVNAGASSGTGTITTSQDADEDHETFTVSLGTLPSAVSAGTPNAVQITIRDDDLPFMLTVESTPACDTRVTDTSVGLRTILVLTPAPPAALETQYRVVTDTEQRGWRASAPIRTSGRSAPATQSSLAQLRSAFPGFAGFDYRLKDSPEITAQCTWRFDGGGDGTPTVNLSVSPNPVREGSSVTVTARLSAALSNNVTIPLTLTNGSAESGDYGSLASITISAGATSGTGAISTNQDTDTADETFTVALNTASLPSSVAAGSPASVVVTINDDDGGGTTPTTPTVTLAASPNPVAEGSPVTVTARLSAAISGNVTIPLTLTNVTAEDGDYGWLTSITISSGSTSGTGQITTNQDTDTNDETFTVTLGNLPSTVRAGSPNSVTVRINDDDQPTPTTPSVSLAVSPNPVTEGASVTVTARLSSALGSNVTIPLRLTDVSAESSDHGSLASITISSGSTTGTGTITTSQDADSDDETFRVALGTLPSSVAAGSPASVVVTISDDDGGGTTPTTPSVSLTASPNPVTEGSPVTVTARLSSALGSNVSIPLALSNGTAEDGDYGSLASITISSGSTSGTGTITTSQDGDSDDETFTVALGNLPSSVTSGNPNSVLVSINDDDEPPPTVSLSVSPSTVDEGDSVTVTATLSATLSRNVRIPLTLTNGTAEDGDYGSLSSITISAGSRTGTGTITTTDDPDSDDETFTVALGNLPATVTAGSPSSVQVTINDDDGGATSPSTLTLTNDRAPAEGGETVTLTATLNRAAPENGTTVTLTASGTATLNTDYTLSSTRISIAEGDTSGTATITVDDDAVDDDDETIVLDASSSNPALTADTLTLTIEDNDDAITYSLSASPETVEEGGNVTITATASRMVAANTEVTLVRDAASTAGDDDFTFDRPQMGVITILDGETSGTLSLTATDDEVAEDDESLTLNGLIGGTAVASVTVTIDDNDELGGPVVTATSVTLSAAPNPVTEGSPVTVTATLSAALESDLTLPLTLTAGTAEAGDYGALESITVTSGATMGTGTVTTTADTDTDDETFTVALGELPTSVKPGSRTSVEITITEAPLPSISLSATPETVEEGGAVTITAVASEAVATNTEVKLMRDGPTSTAGEPDFRFEPPQMGVITISAGQTSGTLKLGTIDDELVEETENLTLNGLVGTRKVGAVTLTIEDNDVPEPEITYTLSGPEDPNLVEGKLYWITVTASAPVPATIEVEIKRDASASTASDDDFRLGAIRIVAGKTTGRRQLYVQVDSDADGGADGSTPETLVLFGRIGAHEFGELRFTLWDQAVPALPIGGALLLGALLAYRGAARARGAPPARRATESR